MIIGIAGKMGSGKSAAIDAIRAATAKHPTGRPVFVAKFAAPLYHIQDIIYRIIEPVYQKPESFVKDRKLLQWLGTDWGRETIRDTLWVDLWKARVRLICSKDFDVTVVSDDVRYDNEAETVRSAGGVMIHVVRSDDTPYLGSEAGISDHSSEAGVRPELIDYTITNDGTLEEFQDAFRKLVEKIESEQGT